MRYPLRSNTKQVNYQYIIHAHNHILIETTGREKGCCVTVKSAFLPFLWEKLNLLAWEPSLGTPAFIDNWPIPFFRVHAKNSPSCCTLNRPIRLHHCDWFTALMANHSKSHRRTRSMSDPSPPFHHCWDQLSAAGLSSRGWFHINRLVIEV